MAALAVAANLASAQNAETGLATGDRQEVVTFMAGQGGAAGQSAETPGLEKTRSTRGASGAVAGQSAERFGAGGMGGFGTSTMVTQAGNARARGVSSSRSAGVFARAGGPDRTLVVPKSVPNAEEIADIEEDLNVMAHILDKAASAEDKTTRAMGVAIYSKTPGATGAPENLYIEGYGAIFFLNVNFPLLAPPAKDVETSTKENTSSEWEDARREITGQSPALGGFGGGYGGGAGGGLIYGGSGGSLAGFASADYDADKVEDLQKNLIASLKNAAHIRKLESDETVTVVVTAPGSGAGSKRVKVVSSDPYAQALGAGEAGGWSMIVGQTAVAGANARLILHARKADAEAFQKGNLSLDDFRQKVSLLLY